MIFAKKNRRRVDLAKKTAELKAAASSAAPAILRFFGATTLIAVIVFAAILLAQWARRSPHFAVDTLSFSGNRHATDAELSRAAGLQRGQNLVATDAFAIERQLAAHPWVKAATVTRRFPRVLELRIIEHRPVAIISLGDLYLLDEDGEPFKRLQPSEALDLPIVTGIERDDYLARHDFTVARIGQALAAAQQYSATSTGLSEVHLDEEGVTLVGADGLRIRLGEGRFEEKLGRLARVRQELRARALTPQVIRLDNRAAPSSVTVSLHASPERGRRTGK